MSTSTAITIRPKQLRELLLHSVRNRRSTLITGAPGVGKTDIVESVRKELKADMLLTHAVISDPTDLKGLPWPDANKEQAKFLPYGDLAKALHAKDLTIWFLDDFGQAPPAVQSSVMQLLLARQINGHRISDQVVFIGATNRRADKAGVQGILEPVKSRFSTIVELKPVLDDWTEWAMKQENFSPEVIAFIRFRPDHLFDFKPTTDMTNSPCPRTWAHVSQHIVSGLPHGLEFPVISGCVGEGPAGEFQAFLKLYRELPDVDEVLASPKDAPIPEDPATLFALVTAIAHRVTRKTARSTFEYAQRLSNEGQGEFAMLLVKDSVTRDHEIANTKAFIDLISKTKFGKILGVDFK